VLGALDGLARHRLLDRVLRGRISIALVAFALIGIVTLQLGLLKLNSSIGHTLERQSLLQRQNATLSIENSEMTAGDRVETRAAQMGMQLVPVGSLRFLSARPRGDAGRAAAALNKAPAQAPVESSEAGTGSSVTAAGSGAPASEGEQSATAASGAPTSSESSSGHAGEATQPSGEPSSHPTSSPTPATSAPAAGESAPAGSSGSSSTEAGPGGGTQAAPTG